MLQYLTQNSQETKKLARILALEATKIKSRKPLIFGLVGDLGSGKTTFIQGFIRGLGIKKRITSPSFLIMRSYKLPACNALRSNAGRQATSYKKIYHIDCYRLKKPKELLVLGLREILADSQNLVLIEWADKIKKILPKEVIYLKFKHNKLPNQRLIKLS